jgi:PPR repeat
MLLRGDVYFFAKVLLTQHEMDHSFLRLHELGEMQHVMMDIYASTNQLEQVETLFEQHRNSGDVHPFTSLITAYSNWNQPERAELLVAGMLRNESQRSMVNIALINGVINAWAECTTANRTLTAEHAYNVYKWISSHEVCIKLRLQPNIETYTPLFECMSKAGLIRSSDSKSTNPRNLEITKAIVSKVDDVLNDVERQYITSGGNSCKPNITFYNFAIQAYLNCKNFDRAESILQKLEHQMSIPPGQPSSTFNTRSGHVFPTIATYSKMLQSYGNLGTIEGAEWAEQLHNHMRKLSQTINPTLKPNVSTYNLVLTGWAGSGATNCVDRIWKVYEQMLHVDRIALDVYNYTTLISALTKTKTSNDIQRAIELLQTMKTKAKRSSKEQSPVHPDGRHYCMVLNGCVSLHDVDNAAHVMNMYIDAYLMQRCRPTDHPDRAIVTWIVSTWIERNELILASWFLFDTMSALAKANSNVNVATKYKFTKQIRPDDELIMKLHDAWSVSQHPEKKKYMSRINAVVVQPVYDGGGAFPTLKDLFVHHKM